MATRVCQAKRESLKRDAAKGLVRKMLEQRKQNPQERRIVELITNQSKPERVLSTREGM